MQYARIGKRGYFVKFNMSDSGIGSEINFEYEWKLSVQFSRNFPMGVLNAGDTLQIDALYGFGMIL